MRNKLIILFAFVFVFSIFLQAVSADVMIPGEKDVSWCYEISNINDYPDYVFVFNPYLIGFGHGGDLDVVINKEDCFNFYRVASIYAIQKTEFNESELNTEFFEENNPKLIKSDIDLFGFFPVQENDPLQKVVITLDIFSLSENNFDLQKSKVIYTYTDDTSEEKVFQSQEIMPEPSKTTSLQLLGSPSSWSAKYWYDGYVILPIVAIILIGIILLLRRLKK